MSLNDKITILNISFKLRGENKQTEKEREKRKGECNVEHVGGNKTQRKIIFDENRLKKTHDTSSHIRNNNTVFSENY